MRIIGLTGSIASGKSTVSAMLREIGAAVVDADAIVHDLQRPGTPVLGAIVREFGPGVLRPDGSLDRQALGRIVFADAGRRRALEAIVHPAVRAEMRRQIEEHRRAGRPAVVLDIPLLFESGWDRMVDEVWLVYVDGATQKARLMARSGLSPEEAEARIAAQMDLEGKGAAGRPGHRQPGFPGGDPGAGARGLAGCHGKEGQWDVRRRGRIRRRLIALLALPLLVLGVRAALMQGYPIAYRTVIADCAEEHGLDPYLVAAVIRESRFRPEATSPQGARGLMQIMPDTGRWVAEQMGLPYDDAYLYDLSITSSWAAGTSPPCSGSSPATPCGPWQPTTAA